MLGYIRWRAAKGASVLRVAHLVEQRKSFVFSCFHYFALARPLVVDAHKVQNAVYDDAVQLVVVSLAKLLGIGAHRVEADKQVAAQHIALAVVEGDDVGVIVVLEVLAVHLEYLFVVAEHVGHLAHALVVRCCHGAHPCGGFAVRYVGHLDVDGVV